jgi:hypothetical protein
VLEEEIDHFQTPNVGREIVFPFRLEQLVEERRGGGALRDCLEEFRGRLGDAVIAEQAFAHRGLDATVAGDLFCTCGPDRFQDFVDQQGIVGRVDRHRIAHFVGDAGPRERDLEMAGVLFRVGTVQPAVDQHPAGKRILAGISRGRRRLVRHDGLVCACFHIIS